MNLSSKEGGFKVITEVHERVKIYNKEGYDWATKKIRYYTSSSSDSEKVILKGAKTYRLEEGKVKAYKFKKSDVFLEKVNKYWSKKIFTMPKLTEGCVVEWKYKLISPYKSIDKLNLQYGIPAKRVQCKIEIPEYYIFDLKSLGFERVEMKKYVKAGSIILTSKSRSGGWGKVKVNYSSQNVKYDINVMEVSKDFMPALKEESYVNNINNYRTSIKYELSAVSWPNEPIKYFSKNWSDVAKTILKKSGFGAEMNKKSYFKKDLELLKKEAKNQQELLNSIFSFVKSKVKWNGYNGLYTDKGVKSAYKNGTGNIAEINLILVAMLREAGIAANPVLASTRSNGVPVFPTIDGFNYVLAAVEKVGNVILLDASEKYSAPNILPSRILNWKGRIVREDKTSDWVALIPVKHSKKDCILSVIINDDDEINGFLRTKYSNNAALKYRNNYNAFSDEELLEEIDEKNKEIDVSLANIRFKEDIHKSIVETVKFSSEDLLEEVNGEVFLKPLLFLGETTNPFKMENRVYPIDYGTPWSNSYKISIKIPENYNVVSVPESIELLLKDGMGHFVMFIKEQKGGLSVKASLSINTGMIPASDYELLKVFYKKMLKKMNEKIVFKKM